MEKPNDILKSKTRDLSKGPFLFVVNPNGGRGSYRQFLDCIGRSNIEAHTVVESTSPDHMVQLARDCSNDGYKACIAVGGDGTVHGIASELIGTDVALGIIPTGSGNGIARHLGISMDIATALKQMLNPQHRKIDTLLVNKRSAVGFCGVGFDGFVAQRFSETSGRGFGNYIKLTMEAFGTFTSQDVLIDGMTRNLYSVLISNVSQLGNDAFINPIAVDDDGELEVIQIETPLWVDIPGLVTRLFNKTFHKARNVQVSRQKSIVITNPNALMLQIDGEPVGCPEKISVAVNPRSLNVLIP